MSRPSVKSVLLRNVRIVLPNRVIEGADLLTQNSRIARILESPIDHSIEGNSVVDLSGLTLFPGFIDIHIHGAAGVDAMEANDDELRGVGDFLARNGITAWLPTLVPAPDEQYQRAIEVVRKLVAETSASDSADDHRLKSVPRVLGVHYEGPFVSSEQCGALHREHFQIFQTVADLDSLPTIDNDNAIHMMTLAPEIEGGIELIKQLKNRNWVVSVGHTRAEAAVLDAALEAGAQHMTHFMNAMTGLHHRTLGAVGWGMVHDDVTCDVIADGIHINPSILQLILRTKSAERVSLISDAIAATGLGDGRYTIWGEAITVKDGRTQNERGSIAGSVITMLDAVRMMLSLSVTESDVARTAALNPARLLGIDSDCGSIEVGKRADLVALDDDRDPRLTMIGGQIAFQS